MPRGPANQAKQAQATAGANAAGYGANAKSMFGPLNTQAESLINSKGYDPATLAAITNAGMGGVNAAFGGAGAQINRNAARRGNVAGTSGELDTLAMNKGLAGGEVAGGIQIQNQEFQNRQRMAGLNLLNSLYGQNVGAQLGNEQARVGAINAETAASPGWAQTFSQILSGIAPKGIVAPPGGGGGGGGG